jgi:hypothetical protein
MHELCIYWTLSKLGLDGEIGMNAYNLASSRVKSGYVALTPVISS